VARQALKDALVSGDDLACREIVLNLFLEGHKLSLLCDVLLAEVFREIGLLWECGDIEIYRERRACRMCVRVLHELRSLVPPPPASGPLAMGGTPHGDFYELPTTMVELVLRANGWQATSLGSSLPATTLAAAIADYRPRIFWLSVSHIENEEQFLADYAELYALAAGKTALVVGGFALTESVRKRMQYAAFCDNLQHLEAFLDSLPATTTKVE
jgi:methanogenic corrinoid protein MtbC1